MTLRQNSPAVNRSSSDGLPHLDATRSFRAARRSVSPSIDQASPSRLMYRVRLLWADPSAPSARREEVHRFSDPRKLCDLVRRIREAPDRPFLSVALEAIAKPRWEPVSLDYVVHRAAQRDRRDEVRRTLERRAEARRGGPAHG